MSVKPDLSEFYKLSKPKRPPCQVAHALEQLDPGERVQLEAALNQDPGLITNAAIQLWLGSRKHDISVNRVVSHRKRNCTCGDD